MKTTEELKQLKDEVEALSKKLSELSEEEIIQITGGSVDDELDHYKKDVQDYLDGIINPDWKYRSH